LPQLDYKTMQEMAECGAKVLNAQAVEWARANRITIVARRTGDALKTTATRETQIGGELSSSGRPRAIVSQAAVGLLRGPSSALSRLLTAAERAAVTLGDWTVSGEQLCAWLPLGQLADADATLAALKYDLGPDVSLEDDASLLSLVGVEVGCEPQRVAQALAALPCPARALFGHSLRQSVVVAQGELENAARTWHRALVTGEGERLSA
jgi:aspartate kinase